MSFAIRGRPMKLTGTPAACQAPPIRHPTEPAPRIATRKSSAAAAIRRDALVRQPQPFRRRSGLPEDVDRHSPARVPIAADPQPPGLHLFGQPLANADGHVLVEAAMIAKRAEEQLEALAL